MEYFVDTYSLACAFKLVFYDVLVLLALFKDNLLMKVRSVNSVWYCFGLAAEALSELARADSVNDGAIHEISCVQMHRRLVRANCQPNFTLCNSRMSVQMRWWCQRLVEYETVVNAVSVFNLFVGLVYIFK